MNKKQAFFSAQISLWGKENDREMPWKGEKNPYFIWLSEIILQQTRVAQGTSYYLAFKKKYPTIFDLAKAKEEEVLKLWEGLGYYSRARNLHYTAKYIVEKYQGVFPATYQELLQLKGVGAYTAAAIASFAFGVPKAVVDGNVVRVLSRYFGVENAFHSAQEKRAMHHLADSLVVPEEVAVYNQAIMDFGAEICTPKTVDCTPCFLKENCYAFLHKKQTKLPIARKKIKQKQRCFYFLVMTFQEKIYIEKRQAQDIWKGLHQFPLIEKEKIEKLKQQELKQIIQHQFFQELTYSKTYKQTLSHQKINAQFITIELEKPCVNAKFIAIDKKKVVKFAFPKIINVYLGAENKL